VQSGEAFFQIEYYGVWRQCVHNSFVVGVTFVNRTYLSADIRGSRQVRTTVRS